MSISGIGSARGFDLSQMASEMASRMVKDLDTNGDGSIDKAEFTAGLTAKGISADEAAKRFDSINTNGTGKITQSDIESSIKTSGGKVPAPVGGGKAAPPAGGPPAGSAAKSGRSSKSSDSASYDPKDTNQDGTVSTAEELAYDLKHPAEASTKKSNTSYNQQGKSTERQKVGSIIDMTA
jgi:hypothetical protein